MANPGIKTAVEERLSQVVQHIQQCTTRAGRDINDIQLITVSKTRTLDEVEAVVALGQKHFGENTIQDAMTKIPEMADSTLQWHFIGHLQSKKAGKIPGYFQWIHSIDSLKLAQKLSTAMLNHSKTSVLNCLIQVNVSAEQSKSGLLLEQVKPFLQQLIELNLPCLQWRGLMTIGVKGDEQQTRDAFAGLKNLQQECQTEFSLTNFDQLSMGMSSDYCLAIEEGATMVRIGTSIFGVRE